MEDSGSKSDLMNSGHQEVSEEKNVSMWPRDCSCDILVKNVIAFCPCLKSLPGVKGKDLGINPLAEEISKLPSIDPAVW